VEVVGDVGDIDSQPMTYGVDAVAADGWYLRWWCTCRWHRNLYGFTFSLPTRNSATAVFWQALYHALRARCMPSSSPEDIARSVKKVPMLGWCREWGNTYLEHLKCHLTSDRLVGKENDWKNLHDASRGT